MKGLIDVTSVITRNFQGEMVVNTIAIVKDLKTNMPYGKNYGNLQVKPRHELKFDTVQYLAGLHNMRQNLDDKGGIKFTKLEADFIYAKQKNSDEWYHVIIVNLGTVDTPINRAFYLTSRQEASLKTMKLEYEFTKTERVLDEESDKEEDE